MRIIVFGASSRAGLYIVKEALEREHRVAAFTRRPEAFPLGHPKLEVIGGDVLDSAAIARAISGGHGVICALGAGSRKTASAVYSGGMENIIRAMGAAGCRRMVWLSSAGCLGRGIRAFFGRGFGSILRARGFSGREGELERLRSSGLEWTLVTAPRYREGAGLSPIKVRFDGRAGKYVYLADLAVFLVKELESGRYGGKLCAAYNA